MSALSRISSHRPLTSNLVISAIKSCTKKIHLLEVHALLLRTSLIQNHDAAHHFLSRASLPPSPPRDILYSRSIFSQLRDPSTSHYNTMIRAYSMSDSPLEGLCLYRQMKQNAKPANPLASSFALKCCVKLCYFFGGLQIHGRIFRDGHVSDGLLLTTLMELYSISGRSEAAYKVFDEMMQRDTVAWNVLMSCYLRNKRTRDVLSLFDGMKNAGSGIEPDDVTCLLALQACSNLGALEFGEKVHGYINEHGYRRNLNICNSLISMYSRCGCLDRASDVFDGIEDKNVVSWTAIISGLAMNGDARAAILAFREMESKGICPEEQTFTAVLAACSHSGLVDEGMMFFHQMSCDYGIDPNTHHYGCIVDLLGRANLLDQAYQLIISMKFKPDATIWRTLLGACRIHGHMALAERVIEHLVEFKAEEAGDYVLLLNVYSLASNWDKVTQLRKFMKEKGIQTTPGCSTVELKGVLHEFVADVASHPRMEEIYELLDEINHQLKIAGYEADVKSELHNLGEEEKSYALSNHSEKLAIAFSILATPPGTTIRIAKNLRTCVDCHNFAKFISSVYNREVIIRDRARFHHFRHGQCSCKGYW